MKDSAAHEVARLDRVRAGDFSAMREAFSWEDSAVFAHLLHGYDVSAALGLGELAFWANERADEAALTGSWRGNAIEPSVHDDQRRRGERFFDWDETANSGAYFAVVWQYGTTLREAALRAERDWPFPVTAYLYDRGSAPAG